MAAFEHAYRNTWMLDTGFVAIRLVKRGRNRWHISYHRISLPDRINRTRQNQGHRYWSDIKAQLNRPMPTEELFVGKLKPAKRRSLEKLIELGLDAMSLDELLVLQEAYDTVHA